MLEGMVSAQELADTLNMLRPTDPMWSEGGFRVGGRWLEIDPELSDLLAAKMLRCDLDTGRRRNEREARWLVAGGVCVVYRERRGWEPAPLSAWELLRREEATTEGEGTPEESAAAEAAAAEAAVPQS